MRGSLKELVIPSKTIKEMGSMKVKTAANMKTNILPFELLMRVGSVTPSV